jgi:hypothetical protein
MSTYNYAYSYYGLTNKCLPRTIAITDNSKFNVGTMVKVYLNTNISNCNCKRNCNCINTCTCNSNCNCRNCNQLRNNKQTCNQLTNHSDPKDIKAFDKNNELCLNEETEVEPSGCKTCSVENLI